MPRVLVVDDEAAVRESLRMLLKKESDVETAQDVDSALAAIEASTPDLILLDVVMPGRSGLDLLPELAERGLRIPVIVLTATNTVAVAVQAMKAGAADFLTKPFELDALRIKVRQLLNHRALELEVERLRDEVEDRQQLGEMVGRSSAMREIFRTIERVAKTQASVLITGASGTGKELVARAMHSLSPRTEAPFIAVNCGAIPHDLIESELFGHERGAFTGATDRRIGRFEAAEGGTLFLDEIGELDPSVQVKLLRALQERVIERVGSSSSIEVDVRVVAATNRDLDFEIQNGRFRQDLFYRINVVPIHLPALCERREDILLLTDTFLSRISERDAGPARRLSPAARAAIESYVWPGNVRELQNAIEHGLALADGNVIELEHLPLAIRNTGSAEALREALERASWNQTHAASELSLTRRVLKLKMDRFRIKPPN